MKQELIDYTGDAWQEVDAALSFGPFVRYLRNRIAEETGVKTQLYKLVLEQFKAAQLEDQEIPVDKIYDYAVYLEWMYACLTPVMEPEQKIYWALWVPVRPALFYGTDAFYELIQSHKIDLRNRTVEDYRRERLQMVYSFILKKFYHYHPRVNEYYHAYLNPETELLQYYTIHINTELVEVAAIGELPSLNLRKLNDQLQQGAGYEVLEEMLPLNLFRFRGMSASVIKDITAHQVVDNLREVRLNRIPGDRTATYELLIRSLKTLVRNKHIEFDLFPLVQVNDKFVYGFEMGGTGILHSVWGEKTLSPEAFQQQASMYAAKPDTFYSPDIRAEVNSNNQWLQYFVEQGVRSLYITPVFYNDTMVGSLCMHTYGEYHFDEQDVARLEMAMRPVAQLLQDFIDEFNEDIETVIREQFTAIQPSVQWKFREIAWQFLYLRKKQLAQRPEKILFKELSPLYGAIDIRNSSIERNKANIADMDSHLAILAATLTDLQTIQHSPLMDEMVYTTQKWNLLLQRGELSATEEAGIGHFLGEEIDAWFRHLAAQNTSARNRVDEYMRLTSAADSPVFRNRQALEVSMQTINEALNSYLESENNHLQQLYPCYFEKFRTDGIEYDIYVGQSITPDKPFNHYYLKNLRLWQLTSMAAIARLTHALLPQLPIPLRTTQLLFVHDHAIDISFRTDERRFDVEGAYNIRYQMIKKRIDKVHIRHTTERLTQPGTISLIYFDRKDLEDYLPYLQYLQEMGTLAPTLEELELEDLQGINGLRAIRVGVVL
jgi:GAF domain-containing protein